MNEKIDDKRQLLKHFLATLAYRTQKALRDAPESFADFQAGEDVRTPHELLTHMTGCIMWAQTAFIGGKVELPSLPTMSDEITRFHKTLESLGGNLSDGTEPIDTTLERLLQGPLCDAMTHAGQLAMLRRMHGSPVKGENFRTANINADNLTPNQPEPK